MLYYTVPYCTSLTRLDFAVELSTENLWSEQTHEPVRNMHGHFMVKASGTGAPGEDMELATMPGRDPLNPDKNTRPCDYITQES